MKQQATSQTTPFPAMQRLIDEWLEQTCRAHSAYILFEVDITEVRGRVTEMTSVGAEAHADRLTQRYRGGRKQHFYGDVYSVAQRERETRVIVKIAPTRVSLDAVFR